MDIYSRAYCKTHHVARMWNFNPEVTRTSEKGQRRSPEIVSRFPEYSSRFPEIGVLIVFAFFWVEIPHSGNMVSLTMCPRVNIRSKKKS